MAKLSSRKFLFLLNSEYVLTLGSAVFWNSRCCVPKMEALTRWFNAKERPGRARGAVFGALLAGLPLTLSCAEHREHRFRLFRSLTYTGVCPLG